ncbi:hypothetical protein [uncultured Campylobacter sp.]|uniref:hypothetical protein n=1 Tax=uncultured Campylobacter sp. TaxID=218934 RepID=UPI002632A7EA|nr:hypothetical protein [uncultured Campylobacter sp.]
MEFYRDEISYGKIPRSKILDKILRQISAFCILKTIAKPAQNRGESQQDRSKILRKVHANAKSANFSAKSLQRNFAAKSSFKAAQNPLKDQKAAAKSSR